MIVLVPLIVTIDDHEIKMNGVVMMAVVPLFKGLKHLFTNGRLVRHCGIVTLRQQPETASGVVFVSLEDETGVVQVIVWKHLRERQRTVLTQSRLLAVFGVWQREGEAKNLIAGHLEDLTPLLHGLSTVSRDFH